MSLQLRDTARALFNLPKGLREFVGATITTAGKNLLDDADAAAQRTTLGLQGTGVGLVPAGGTTGQVLKKASNSDYNYSWQADATGGGGGGGSIDDALALDALL